LLNRTGFVFEDRRNGVFNNETAKWVNNAAINYKSRHGHQLSVNLGAKYVVDQIDEERYRSFTALLLVLGLSRMAG
jgi:hypothetical protein